MATISNKSRIFSVHKPSETILSAKNAEPNAMLCVNCNDLKCKGAILESNSSIERYKTFSRETRLS